MDLKTRNASRIPVSGATRLLLAIALASTSALADPPPGKGKNKTPPGQAREQSRGSSEHSPNSASNGRVLEDLLYAGITTMTARGVLADSGFSLSGHKPLPPGIRKNLARGKPLPPGIALTRIPDDHLRHLPSHPGYEWLGAGTDLLLVELGSRIIADVLIDVFR